MLAATGERGDEQRRDPQVARSAPTKSQRTRQRILDSAARVFRDQGYSARLSDIAAEAGMQAGSLYYHFDSREHLVAEVLHRGTEIAWDSARAAVDALPADASAGLRLETAIRAHAAAVLEISDYTAAHTRILSMASAEVREREHTHERRYGAWFGDLLTAAADAGDIRADLDLPVVRMLLFGAMNWTSEWYRPGDVRPASHVIDQLVELVLGGLRR
ncbi:MAG: TetR family transcriptional regulator [Actinomycetota bacterium]|nr:TetR family transcriptional regulator [Actinomycetota bacterium]